MRVPQPAPKTAARAMPQAYKFWSMPNGTHSFVEANPSGRKPWFIPLVSFEREWGY
jgi:hypothetical protein